MGSRGPAPKSKQDLERAGSWRAKDRPDDLQLEPASLVPPEHLDGVALDEWNRVTGLLEGVLSHGDRMALITLCERWADMAFYMRKQRNSIVGTAAHREARLARKEAESTWSDLIKRFGLTPVDRPRVKKPQKDTDDKADFFKLVG